MLPEKNRWKFLPYLGSETRSNPAGIFILKKTNRTNYYMGVETSAVSSGASIAGKSLDGMLVGGLPEEDSFAPLSFKK